MSQKDIFEDGRGYNLSHRKRSPFPKGESICAVAPGDTITFH